MPQLSNSRLSQSYFKIEHKSGLTLMLCPMEGFKTTYALFGAGIGSIDDTFSINGGEIKKVPAGIAHFLEHKLFENEEGDAFELYAKVGASANAYTSFDRTAYLFSCTENFEKALPILINLVTKPYFTKETVEKEQGIIGQEIKMYEDDPDWRVYFNLLGALYQNHPLKIDIAGTVETISHITAEMLYECHKAFYSMGNMALCIAGNFDIDTVTAICDEMLKDTDSVKLSVEPIVEPKEIKTERVEQKLEVASPIFQLGFKGVSQSHGENVLTQVIGEMVCDIIVGESSMLYRKLYDEGLINPVFGSEVMAGPSYHVTIFAGESKNPDEVSKQIRDEIKKLQSTGISKEAFDRAQKSCLGRFVGIYSSVEAMAGMLLLAELSSIDAYDPIDIISRLTLNDAQAYLRENLDCQYSALSVVIGE